MKAPIGGGTVIPIASGLSSAPSALAVDGTSVYWTSSNVTMSASLVSGAVSKLASVGGTAIAVDTTSVYVVNGAVISFPLRGLPDGASPTTIPVNANAFAIDATSVYATGNGGAVVKVTPK
jgi:hypothetical protein